MTNICPKCGSEHVVTKDIARVCGGMIGTVGGALSGASGAFTGANIGSKVGIVGGPLGIVAGTVAGAILGALLGGTTGGVAGSQLGRIVDEKVLNNYKCQNCGHEFGLKSSSDVDINDIRLP